MINIGKNNGSYGKSAYQYVIEGGYIGTEQQYYADLSDDKNMEVIMQIDSIFNESEVSFIKGDKDKLFKMVQNGECPYLLSLYSVDENAKCSILGSVTMSSPTTEQQIVAFETGFPNFIYWDFDKSVWIYGQVPFMLKGGKHKTNSRKRLNWRNHYDKRKNK